MYVKLKLQYVTILFDTSNNNYGKTKVISIPIF
jgi:hypothetical protein